MRHALAMPIVFALCAPAAAQHSNARAAAAVGLWLKEDGSAQVRVAPCADALCGFVAWVKDPQHASDIGLRVFYDMKPSAPNEWQGKAFNPEDGNTYSGKLILDGATLKTAGCVLGGLICKSYGWTRLK